MTSVAPDNINEAPMDTGEAIARLLISRGLITTKQLKHAVRVRAKLAQPKSLLNTMLDLEFFNNQQLNAALREGALEIRLGDLLVERGDIGTRELETAIRMQRDPAHDGKKLGEILIEQRFIKENRLIDVIAHQPGFMHVEPEFSAVDRSLLSAVRPAQCEQAGFMPIRRKG